MYCDSGLGGWAALCREAGHDTAMPARTHGHDTGAGRRCWEGARRQQAGAGRWADWALGPGARGRRAAAGAGVGAHGARGAGGSDARGALARQAQGGAGSRLGRAGRPAGLPVRTSWARLGVLVHLTQFLAWFDSVLFVSH